MGWVGEARDGIGGRGQGWDRWGEARNGIGGRGHGWDKWERPEME
jgi:hypothetical protein